MKFAYEDLSSRQFEELVILICRKLFGISVPNFSEGADGGRDSRFTGRAELFPSKASPWDGKVIIQAKHTSGYNKSFSDTDFFSVKSNNTIIAEEIPKISKLRANSELDFYILFSNRRLTANTDSNIRAEISSKCNIEDRNVSLVGVETIESYLKMYPDILSTVKLDPVDSPLAISPNELSEIIEILKEKLELAKSDIEKAPTSRTSFEQKNKLNNMTDAYAKEQVRRYLKHTYQVKEFLSAPENVALMSKYDTIAEEFNLKIISKRKDYQTFDEIMEYIFDHLVGRDELLRGNRRLTRVLLFYMYWNCDVGNNNEAN